MCMNVLLVSAFSEWSTSIKRRNLRRGMFKNTYLTNPTDYRLLDHVDPDIGEQDDDY